MLVPQLKSDLSSMSELAAPLEAEQTVTSSRVITFFRISFDLEGMEVRLSDHTL